MGDTKHEPINGLPAGRPSGAARRDEKAGFAETTGLPQTVVPHAARRENLRRSGSVCKQVDCAWRKCQRGICPIWRSESLAFVRARLRVAKFYFFLPRLFSSFVCFIHVSETLFLHTLWPICNGGRDYAQPTRRSLGESPPREWRVTGG